MTLACQLARGHEIEGVRALVYLGRGGAAVLDRRVAERGEVAINGAFFTSAAARAALSRRHSFTRSRSPAAKLI